VPALLAGACAFTPVQDITAVQQPKAQPVRNVTSFSESLRCMDELLRNFGVNDIILTSSGIPDATGEVKTGTKEMLISAISQMSVDSNAFRFVDFDQSEGQRDVNVLWSTAGQSPDFQIPNYYIRGAITQLDQNVVSETQSGSVALKGVQIGASRDQVLSVVSVDLNVADLQTRQILPGLSSHNSIALRRTGKGLDGQGRIEKSGISFNVSFDKSEGMHQAVRTLIELSTIEVLGRLAEVPYWRCLEIRQTDPAVTTEARDWFARMDQPTRVRFVQRALHGLGRYDGPVTGQLDDATREALASWQAERGLLGNGRIDFDTYAALISGDLAMGRMPPANATPVALHPSAAEAPKKLRATLTTARGPAADYKLGEDLKALLLTNKDGYAYCYYRDASGRVSRIFPNRFQPSAAVPAGKQVAVPPASQGFSIVLDTPGNSEEVRCLVAERDLAGLVPELAQGPDLTPLPVNGMPEISQAFRAAGGQDVIEVNMPITVAAR
jgi:peptidoglycan hydrolase-like protein with peptidoglycan-binding domain